jgi:hypothetical protein
MKEKENKKRAKTPYKRKIHINGKEWSYKIISNAVLVCDPEGMKTWKRELDFSNLNPSHDFCCDCQSCETGTGGCIVTAITPSRVKKFIERVCLPELR